MSQTAQNWSTPSAIANLATTPHAGTGLSERDIYLIRHSWAMVAEKKVAKQNAVELFIQLFKKFPDLKRHFPVFQNLSDDELRACTKLRAHAMGVVYKLSSYIDNLEDAETLVALVTSVSVSHMTRNVTEQDFRDLGTMFVPFLRTVLGRNVTPETEEGWTKLLGAQAAIYKATLEAPK